jgi:hypothetical protein
MKKFLIILACMAVTHLSAQPGVLDKFLSGPIGDALCPPFISSPQLRVVGIAISGAIGKDRG